MNKLRQLYHRDCQVIYKSKAIKHKYFATWNHASILYYEKDKIKIRKRMFLEKIKSKAGLHTHGRNGVKVFFNFCG